MKNAVGTELQLGPRNIPTRVKRPRLESFSYKGTFAYHIVISTRHSQAAFSNVKFAVFCSDILATTSTQTGFRVLAYCLMPDHTHLLVQGTTESSDLVRLIQRFKQSTAFHYKRRTGSQLWQQSFYDRVLRADEDLRVVAEYIFWKSC